MIITTNGITTGCSGILNFNPRELRVNVDTAEAVADLEAAAKVAADLETAVERALGKIRVQVGGSREATVASAKAVERAREAIGKVERSPIEKILSTVSMLAGDASQPDDVRVAAVDALGRLGAALASRPAGVRALAESLG